MIFLDTSGIVALWNRRDQWHDAATDAWQRVPPGTPLLTTSYVLAECANAFARSELRIQLVRLTDHLISHDRLVFPKDAEWHRAKLAYAHERPGLPTLIDHLSFAAMRRLGIRRVFTNDGHFRDAGFEALF